MNKKEILTDQEKSTLIELMMKVGEHGWVFNNFNEDLSLEQKLDILKVSGSNEMRANIAKTETITQEMAKDLNRASRYSQQVKWALMCNQGLSMEFRKKLLTKGMVKSVVKEEEYITKTNEKYMKMYGRGFYRADEIGFKRIKAMLPEDIWTYVKQRLEDAQAVKDIIM